MPKSSTNYYLGQENEANQFDLPLCRLGLMSEKHTDMRIFGLIPFESLGPSQS